MKLIQEYFAFCRERHRIHINRNVLKRPPPWTDNPILANHHWTNVFRELDRTTTWIRENVREPLRNDPKVFLAMITCRWFCRIETLEKLKDMLLEGTWDAKVARRRLYLQQPVVTGAFMVHTIAGKDKLDGVLWAIEQVAKDADRITSEWDPNSCTLEKMFDLLRQYPYYGPFMCHEFVQDLRHTWMLEKATDINTWSSLGPGAVKGIGYIVHGDEKHWQLNNQKHQQEMVLALRDILSLSRKPENWPPEWGEWELHTAEFTACEFSKYMHALEGRKLKRRYP